MSGRKSSSHELLDESSPTVAVVGSGPAGLMATTVLAHAGCQVHLFEKQANLSRKLFIAGSSGLNISSSLPQEAMIRRYSGPPKHWEDAFSSFSVESWLSFIRYLGLEWFQGTSARYFVRPMQALPLVRAWKKLLLSNGVKFFTGFDFADFSTSGKKGILLGFSDQSAHDFSAVCLALGGASYEDKDGLPHWYSILQKKNLQLKEFQAVNVGYEVDWSTPFLEEAEGKPVKNVVLYTKRGECAGELMITHYGIEGTPVYEMGVEGAAFVDLKPDLSREQILKKLNRSVENLSPIRRAKKFLNLCPATLALLFHHTPKASLHTPEALADVIKKFPLELKARRPLREAISSGGGLCFSELNDQLMMLKFPGVFAAGEMLDWQAPTGGFLIQGCISEGYMAGVGMLDYLGKGFTKTGFGLPKPR